MSQTRCPEAVEILLNREEISIDLTDKSDKTALRVAEENGYTRTVRRGAPEETY